MLVNLKWQAMLKPGGEGVSTNADVAYVMVHLIEEVEETTEHL